MGTASGLPISLLRPQAAEVRLVVAEWESHALLGAKLEDSGEEQKWEACREYQRAHESASLRAIADKVGRSHMHIQYMVSASVNHGLHPDLSFAEAYGLAKKPTKAASPPDLPTVIEVPEGRFSAIVVDPPWQYDNTATRGAARDHYATMGLDALADLTVPAADNAHLYLWTTNAFLRDAFALVERWGFAYKTTLVWVKPQMGMGNYFRSCHELVLFGVQGKLPILRRDARSWFEADRGRHSAKPDAFYELVETCSPGPYLDMFNRDGGKLFRRPGWTGWGAEA